jgi:hypothetical protein
MLMRTCDGPIKHLVCVCYKQPPCFIKDTLTNNTQTMCEGLLDVWSMTHVHGERLQTGSCATMKLEVTCAHIYVEISVARTIRKTWQTEQSYALLRF